MYLSIDCKNYMHNHTYMMVEHNVNVCSEQLTPDEVGVLVVLLLGTGLRIRQQCADGEPALPAHRG